jgi:hypothetical protein
MLEQEESQPLYNRSLILAKQMLKMEVLGPCPLGLDEKKWLNGLPNSSLRGLASTKNRTEIGSVEKIVELVQFAVIFERVSSIVPGRSAHWCPNLLTVDKYCGSQACHVYQPVTSCISKEGLVIWV